MRGTEDGSRLAPALQVAAASMRKRGDATLFAEDSRGRVSRSKVEPRTQHGDAAAVALLRAWIEARGEPLPSSGRFRPLFDEFMRWHFRRVLKNPKDADAMEADIRSKEDFARLLVGMGLRNAAGRRRRNGRTSQR